MKKITNESSVQEKRVSEIFSDQFTAIAKRIDKIFGYLFVGQWLLGIAFAYFVSPKTWAGEFSQTHIHVYAAVFIGGIIAAFPLFLILTQPGAAFNRYVISVSQMLFSVLLIHLTGGRIETHFHVFGSIAFIAFYRDWRLVVLATIVTGADHLLRGIFWPESVYGVISATPWRALEHAAWVAFEDIVLLFVIQNGVKELWSMSERQMELENSIAETKRANVAADTYRYALDAFAIVAITDSRGKITYANENFCKISKYSRDELVGKTHKIINSGHHPKSFFEGMWKAISLGNTWEGEIQNKAKDGTIYWVDTSIVPVKDENGDVKEYLAVRKDITIRKQLEKSLADLVISLEEKVEERAKKWIEAETKLSQASKMSALGEMAGGMAHEINNPLATIKTVSSQLAEILAEKPFNENLAISMAASITKTTDRIARIVQGLRAFSRDGSADPFQPVNVGELVNETISFCQERLRNNGIDLRVDHIDDTLRFDGRATQVSQVLLNLLNNAHDAISKSETKWIAITALSTEEAIEIRVTDSGNGIPIDIQKKIFQPFFTTKEVGRGTGMGLSISLGIINAHHGVLEIDSKCPNTCFVIKIPKKQRAAEGLKAA